MNEELTPLEALNKIKKKHYFVDFELDITVGKDCKKELDIIEAALKEHELMKQTKIIVANKKINDDDLEKLKNQRMFVGNIEHCETKLLFDEEIQKKLKALEIIVKHKLMNYVIKNKKCANMYHLTNGEIDLLKEVLL